MHFSNNQVPVSVGRSQVCSPLLGGGYPFTTRIPIIAHTRDTPTPHCVINSMIPISVPIFDKVDNAKLSILEATTANTEKKI